MAREDTVICMDNSEWMRNGDYRRTRFEAQYQAIEYLIRVKTGHPENTVGLISLAGGRSSSVQVLCSPTTETFRVGKAAQNAEIGGKADILTGLKVAQLALKFRQQRQIQARIILFVGSPLDTIDQSKLTKIAKQLKKNNIACDVISMGEQSTNTEILQKLIADVSKRDGVPSTLVTVPPGTYAEDAIRSTPINSGPSEEELDPMLAMALAESRAMAEQQDGGAGAPLPPAVTNIMNAATPRLDNVSTVATEGDGRENDEVDDDDDDEALKQALMMSLVDTPTVDDKKPGDVLRKNYVNQIFQENGVDINSKEVQEHIKELSKSDKDKSKTSKEDEKDKK